MVLLTKSTLLRLDLKKKELIQQKEELLKESKTKVTTMDNVKSQIDMLMKVSPISVALISTLISCRLRQKYKRK
jgi:hypothetical protein